MLYRAKQNERTRRRGVVLIAVLVSLVVLMSVVALSGDGGQALAERRNAQAAADAAAVSAASDLFYNWQTFSGNDKPTTAASHAQTVAALQGYSTSNITINVPTDASIAADGTVTGSVKYQGGPNQGQPIPPGYAEVIITYSQPANFSAVFGSGSVTISARAVAAAQWIWAPPILVLAQSGSGTLTLKSLNNSGITISVPKGQAFVNSSNASAMMNLASGFVKMEAAQFNVVGGANPGAGSFVGLDGVTNTVKPGQRPIADPLSLITVAPPGVVTPPAISNNTLNLTPGRYVGGLNLTGAAYSQVTVNMASGLYYMDGGGFKFSGLALNAPNVLIYNGAFSQAAPGAVVISGSGTINLGPQTASAGLQQGITIFQDRTMASQPAVQISHNLVITGQTWTIKGCIYAPQATVAVSNNGNASAADVSVGEQFICNTLTINANFPMSIPGNYVRTRKVALVE